MSASPMLRDRVSRTLLADPFTIIAQRAPPFVVRSSRWGRRLRWDALPATWAFDDVRVVCLKVSAVIPLVRVWRWRPDRCVNRLFKIQGRGCGQRVRIRIIVGIGVM